MVGVPTQFDTAADAPRRWHSCDALSGLCVRYGGVAVEPLPGLRHGRAYLESGRRHPAVRNDEYLNNDIAAWVIES